MYTVAALEKVAFVVADGVMPGYMAQLVSRYSLSATPTLNSHPSWRGGCGVFQVYQLSRKQHNFPTLKCTPNSIVLQKYLRFYVKFLKK
jgi:hypothetical protein